MSNGDQQQYNCILQICCGGEDESKAKRALSAMLVHDLGTGPYESHEIALWIFRRFDLAVKGTLQPLIQSVAGLARGFPYEG